MYDIIGDIHGHGEALEELLSKMGYKNRRGVWSHNQRQAIFLGDYIDRGPSQRTVLKIVRAMAQEGAAIPIMGNHEFNAVAFATPHPEQSGRRLREDIPKHRIPHESFLIQLKEGSAEYQETIEWFKTLPLFLDLPQLRAIHACWHPDMLEIIRPYLTSKDVLREEAWAVANEKGHDAFDALEILLKGMEIALPEGVSYKCKDGIKRKYCRSRWWDTNADNLREIAICPPSIRNDIPESEIREEDRVPSDSDKPLFFGHYWFSGEPELLNPKMACLDYGIGKGRPEGKLCAYRFNGEENLSEENFVWV